MIEPDDCLRLLASDEIGRLAVVAGNTATVVPVNYPLCGHVEGFPNRRAQHAGRVSGQPARSGTHSGVPGAASRTQTLARPASADAPLA